MSEISIDSTSKLTGLVQNTDKKNRRHKHCKKIRSFYMEKRIWPILGTPVLLFRAAHDWWLACQTLDSEDQGRLSGGHLLRFFFFFRLVMQYYFIPVIDLKVIVCILNSFVTIRGIRSRIMAKKITLRLAFT